VIGVITSPTGAVIRDIMHRLGDRFPRRVLLWPVAVQGDRAAAEVAAAIAGFNAFAAGGRLPRPDVLIVARGGGSIEDLMAFNEEIVVRAVAASTIPLISAVGHETDTTLIDFASDRRAPTPTAAAEMAVPLRSELLGQVADFERRTLRCFTKGMEDRRRHLAQLARVLPRADQLFAQPRQALDNWADRLPRALRRNLQEHRRAFTRAEAQLRPGSIHALIRLSAERTATYGRQINQYENGRLAEFRRHLDALGRVLEGVSYKSALERGFALVRAEDGTIRRRANAVAGGESLSLTFVDGTVGAIAGSAPAPAKPGSRGKTAGSQGSLF
jgi:exodeoxyribonuclease VII large subunit